VSQFAYSSEKCVASGAHIRSLAFCFTSSFLIVSHLARSSRHQFPSLLQRFLGHPPSSALTGKFMYITHFMSLDNAALCVPQASAFPTRSLCLFRLPSPSFSPLRVASLFAGHHIAPIRREQTLLTELHLLLAEHWVGRSGLCALQC
jgi:hypothetical protein